MIDSEAVGRLERLLGYLRQDPRNTPLLLESADLAMRVGRGAEALEWLERALTEQPGEPRLAAARGNLLLALERPGEAAEVFQGLIDRLGPDPVLGFNLAQARLFEGRYEEALSLLKALPEASRGQLPDLDLLQARTAYQALRYQEALDVVDRFLKLNPEHADARRIKGVGVNNSVSWARSDEEDASCRGSHATTSPVSHATSFSVVTTGNPVSPRLTISAITCNVCARLASSTRLPSTPMC